MSSGTEGENASPVRDDNPRVAPKNVIAAAAAALLFVLGGTAAFAVEPIDPTDPTTTATTTATTSTTTTTTAAAATTTESTTMATTESTTTTTTTAPTPTTTTAVPSTTTTSTPPAPTTPRAQSARPRAALPRATLPEKAQKVRPPRRHKKRRHRISKPLEVTPPLGQRGYVFPVVGPSGYGDTYGALRSDVRGKWHHGDDIFAPLGAPVVAVASGTVNRVGWKRLGGWRLWVRDRSANQFYYAHLSGYATTIFHSRHVEAGQVIGFVGNTGDAFPGTPHLHFEIHPHQLLRLRYDGAVNPTSYLDSWTRLETARLPLPKHPRLPKPPLFRRQAQQVFRRLLVARDLLEPPARATKPERPGIAFDRPPRVIAGALPLREAAPGALAANDGSSPLLVPVLFGLTSLALFGATTLLALLRRRTRRNPAT